MSQNPFVFIVGCARSGTTLLHRIVDAHPQIAVSPEIHWIANFKKEGAGATVNGIVTKEILYSLLEHKRFPLLGVSRQEFESLLGSDEMLSNAGFLARIFELYGQVKHKPLVGNKTPSFVLRIPALHQLWPKARFVHLIRDGRDVCLSVMNWKKAGRIVGRYPTWTEDSVSTIALWWKQKVRLGREAGSQLGSELYYEIRYEDLTADPERECRALCGFLGVPFSEAMLRFHEGRTKKQANLGSKRSWLPITPGLRDWRTQMPPENIERFEAAAGDLLDQLGYMRRFPDPDQEVQKHATAIYESFTHEIRSRRHLLPKGW
jgi:hypothetical protein